MAQPHYHPLDIFSTDDARRHAETLFTTLLLRLDNCSHKSLVVPYRRVEMVRLMHQLAPLQLSRDRFLCLFFSMMDMDMAELEYAAMDRLVDKVVLLTNYLFDNFFLPLKASSKSPPPTPAVLVSEDAVLLGPADRLATVSQDCLIRDRHRCVISRKFDKAEARKRFKQQGEDAVDDDGIRFVDKNMGPDDFEYVEVAHILPSFLMNYDGDTELHQARHNALGILDLLDCGVGHLIRGRSIDGPTNALILTIGNHRLFGTFRLYFKKLEEPHTYQILSLLPSILRAEPVVRTLDASKNITIGAPLPRLLALHAAVAKIMHWSGADVYCNAILRSRSSYNDMVVQRRTVKCAEKDH